MGKNILKEEIKKYILEEDILGDISNLAYAIDPIAAYPYIYNYFRLNTPEFMKQYAEEILRYVPAESANQYETCQAAIASAQAKRSIRRKKTIAKNKAMAIASNKEKVRKEIKKMDKAMADIKKIRKPTAREMSGWSSARQRALKSAGMQWSDVPIPWEEEPKNSGSIRESKTILRTRYEFDKKLKHALKNVCKKDDTATPLSLLGFKVSGGICSKFGEYYILPDDNDLKPYLELDDNLKEFKIYLHDKVVHRLLLKYLDCVLKDIMNNNKINKKGLAERLETIQSNKWFWRKFLCEVWYYGKDAVDVEKIDKWLPKIKREYERWFEEVKTWENTEKVNFDDSYNENEFCDYEVGRGRSGRLCISKLDVYRMNTLRALEDETMVKKLPKKMCSQYWYKNALDIVIKEFSTRISNKTDPVYLAFILAKRLAKKDLSDEPGVEKIGMPGDVLDAYKQAAENITSLINGNAIVDKYGWIRNGSWATWGFTFQGKNIPQSTRRPSLFIDDGKIHDTWSEFVDFLSKKIPKSALKENKKRIKIKLKKKIFRG